MSAALTMRAELLLLAPELTLLVLACLTLLCDAFSNDPNRRQTFWLATLSLLAVMLLVMFPVAQFTEPPTGECDRNCGALLAFHSHFIADSLSAALKVAVCAASALAFFYAHYYFRERGAVQGEYFVLGLFAVLGILALISANSLLVAYLGLELMSLCLYAMVAMNSKAPSAVEAAMKYFVLGALASGLLLYGSSLLYGISGTLILTELSAYLHASGDAGLMPVFALVFIVTGVAFKLGLVPFHSWLPDVYQGAPTAVTLFLATAPKLAALALALRLLIFGLEALRPDWQGMFIILAVLSMAGGNIIAISQTNIKRMLAYSAIAHAGFLTLGILPGLQAGALAIGASGGYSSALFYTFAYVLMSMGAFGFIIFLGRKGHEAERLDDFKGLAVHSPWFAFVMLLLMFSLAGIPPFLGFWAKWFVLKEIIAVGYGWLAALAVLFSVIGAYYYLRVVKLLYFDEPEADSGPIAAAWSMRVLISLNGLAVLALGLAPGGLMRLCVAALAY